MTRSPAAAALDAWCEAERGRAEGLSRALGVTATTVYNWRRGAILPRAENRIAIEQKTGGAARAVDWGDDSPEAHADETPTAPEAA